MEDLEKYLEAVARAKARSLKHLLTHVNGVCGRSVFVAPFSHVIPPYLHFVLGLVNSALKKMLEDLAKISSADHAALERQRLRVGARGARGRHRRGGGELSDLLGPAERRMVRDMVTNMDMAAGVAAARGAARSVPAPGSVGRHVVVGELAAADWQPLLTAARAAAGASLGQEMARAADWRERGKKGGGADGKPRGPARSQRQHDALLAEPSAYEEYCQKIEAKAEEAHKELVAAVVAVENAIKANEEFDAAECEGPDSKEGEGELVALMKYVLGVHEISIQRYWNGALVGPNCRTLPEKHGETLGPSARE